jgi:cAMP-dependent protein kinase regulator
MYQTYCACTAQRTPRHSGCLAWCRYKQNFEAGVTIINQGDDADHFYVLVEGEVQVLIDGRMKRTLGAGQSFGELALLFGLPRSASCVTQTASVVWVLDRSPFKHIVVREQTRKSESREKFLKTV